MAMLIDNASTSRSNLRTALNPFTAFIKRSQEMQRPKIDLPIASESRLQQRKVVVESGDTLTDIAKTHYVSLEETAQHNPQISDLDYINVGDVVFLPPPAPEQLAVQPDGKLLFLENLQARGNAIEYADTAKAAVDYAVEIEKLTQDVQAFLIALPAGERQDTAQWLFDHDWMDSGPAQTAIEQGADSIGLTLESSSHKGPEVETQVREAILQITASLDPVIALETLGKIYSTATPDIKDALLKSSAAQETLQKAGQYALDALNVQDNQSGQLVPMKTVFERLDHMTHSLDPRLAAEVIDTTIPGLEKVLLEPSDNPIPAMVGSSGAYHLVNVTGHIAGQPGADVSIKRLVDLGLYERTGTVQSIADGASPAYPLQVLSLAGPDDARYVLEGDILPGLDQFQKKVTDDIQAYGKQMEELNWLTMNGSTIMTPEQRDAAVQDYLSSRAPEWEKETQALKDQIAEDGRDLVHQLQTLQNLPADFTGDRKAIEDQIRKTLDNPDAITAMSAAVTQYPELTNNLDQWKLIGQIGKTSDRGRKFLEEVATQLLRHQVMPEFQNIKAGDATSLQDSLDRLERFKGGPIAAMFGVTDKDFNKAIDALKEALPKPGETAEQISDRLVRFNLKLDDLKSTNGVRTFDSQTQAGQALRMIGAAGAAAVLASSGVALSKNQSPEALLKVCLDAAGMTQKTTELLIGLGKVSKHGWADKLAGGSSRPAVKVLGVASSMFDLVNAGKAAEVGDVVGASLYTLSAAGGVTSALGTGTVFGPIGIGVVLLSTITLGARDVIKHHEMANRFQTPETSQFLSYAGLTAEASEVLSNQSGDGYNVLPLLSRYAELKGLDLQSSRGQQEFVSWINSMPKESLELLRNNLHYVLDRRKGAYESFSEFQARSDSWIYDTSDAYFSQRLKENPHFVEMGVAYPNSVYQLDRTLDMLNLDRLAVS
jgi:LysM repeat protein